MGLWQDYVLSKAIFHALDELGKNMLASLVALCHSYSLLVETWAIKLSPQLGERNRLAIPAFSLLFAYTVPWFEEIHAAALRLLYLVFQLHSFPKPCSCPPLAFSTFPHREFPLRGVCAHECDKDGMSNVFSCPSLSFWFF